MERYLKKDFDVVDHKNRSLETLQKWRKAVRLIKNPARRWRHVADLTKRAEVEKKKKQIEAKIHVARSVERAALHFIEAEAHSEARREALREARCAARREARREDRRAARRAARRVVRVAVRRVASLVARRKPEIVYRRGPGCKAKSPWITFVPVTRELL